MLVSCGSHSLRWASEPYVSSIHTTMLWMEMYAATAGSPFASSSNIATVSRRDRPTPPNSSST
jgi:hypothetical protein